MNVLICIPFRDRGIDPLRSANLKRTLEHWNQCGFPVKVFDDGRTGDEQFCRSAAYNRAARSNADVIVYTESDMLINLQQIKDGIELAQAKIGLVVPFTQYRYLDPDDSNGVRMGQLKPVACEPVYTLDDGESIGAINIVSSKTLESVGQWDECFDGAWFDDRAMKRAFDVTCSPTRWVPGPAYHLYHLPGWAGSHLSDQDREAVQRNEIRYSKYLSANSPDQIRYLTLEQPERHNGKTPAIAKNVVNQVNWDNPRNDPTKRRNVGDDPTGKINRKLL